MRRLALQLPTALQYDSSGKVVLFHEGGVSQLLNLDDTLSVKGLRFPPHSPARIWALVDSNDRLIEPAPIFRTRGPFFVVESTSPRQPHLKWPKKVPSRRFYMKTWTFSEVIKAYVTLPSRGSQPHVLFSRPFLGLLSTGPYTLHQLWYLYNTYGASPRALSSDSDEPAAYRDRVIEEVQRIRSDDLLHTVQSSESDESSHFIMAIEPSPGSRNACEKRFISRHVFEMLWERHIRHQVFELHFYYDLLQRSPNTSSSAGWIFESRMHQLLRQGDTIPLFPVHGRVVRANFVFDDYAASDKTKDLQLPESEEHFLDEGTHPRVGRYYRPRVAKFSTIDALFFVQPPDEPSPILLTLQFTRSEEHNVKEGGLCKPDQLDLHTDTRWYLVVVTPEGIQPAITIPKILFGDEGSKAKKGKTLDRLIQVFHSPISMEKLFPRKKYG